MTPIAFGLGTALSWGLADFFGGLFTRRLTLATVLIGSQLTAAAAAAVVVAAAGLPTPSLGEIAPAAGAGASQLIGIAALYGALAIGTMSVVSPVSASGAAVIPVIVGIAAGERPGALRYAGMVAAFAGVVMATRVPGVAWQMPRRAVGLSGLAALGFGGFYVGMDEAIEGAEPFWALLAARATAAVLLLAAVAAVRPKLSSPGGLLLPLAAVGLLDVGANACFTLGTDAGLLSVVSVLASLYPVVTVVLARAVLRERLDWAQAGGVAVALAGVALIAAG